jgi:hypothetical protein
MRGRAEMVYRKLRIHDIVIQHPQDWRISMKGLALPHEGNADILGSGQNQIAVSLSWKPLSRYTDRFPTVDDYALHVIKNFEKERRFSGFQVLSQNSVLLGGHPAIKLHLRFPLKVGTLKRKIQMIDRINLFTYCPKTERAVIVFISFSTNAYEEERDLVWAIVDSVRCH